MMDQQDQSHHDRSRDDRSHGDQSHGGQRDETRADRMSDAFKHRFQAALGDAYALDRELSGGGMSRVFLGRDLMLGRQVVLKVLPPEAAQEPAARFRREAMLVARLQHPHILPVFGVGLVDDIQYFTMPYVEGGTLRTHLEQRRHLPVVDARRVLCEIGDALACAHRQGIVHRDVKPENIFLERRTGRTLLADFGVAFALGEPDGVTQAGTTVGTPAYMSPEQVDGRPLDGLSDIYSLGLVGWEMVTGQRPWSGDSVYDVMYKQKHESLRSLDSFNIEIAPSFVRAIDRALRKDPQERWPSAEAFVAALDPERDREGGAIYPQTGWSAAATELEDSNEDATEEDVVANEDAPTIVAHQHEPFEYPRRERPSGSGMDSQEYEYRARVGWRSSMYGARAERRAERGRSARVMSVAAVVLVVAGAVAGATTAGRRFLMAPFSTAAVASGPSAETNAEGDAADIGKLPAPDVVSTLTAPTPSTRSVAGTAVAAPVVKVVPRVAEATVSHDSPQSHRGRRAYADADARPGRSVRARVATAELQLRAYERVMAHEPVAVGQQSTPAAADQPVVRAPAVRAPAASVPVSSAPVASPLPASVPAASAPPVSAPAVSTPRVSVPAATSPAVASPAPPPAPSSDPPLAPAIPTTSGESPSAPPSGVSGNAGGGALVVASGPAKAVRVRGAALTPGSGLGNGVPVSSTTCRPAFPGSHVCRVYDAHTGQVVGYQFVPGGTSAQSR
jgi:serine/threonine protein kinase